MTAVEQTSPAAPATVPSEFATELQHRVDEARAALQAAEHMDDPLLAQIAEADLADLRALADRNDVEVS